MDKKVVVLFLAIFTVLVFLSFLNGPLNWDALVYIMNAKKIVRGSYVYYEDFRPPLLPLTYAALFKLFSESEAIPRVLSLLFSVAAALTSFFLIKELYGTKVAYYSTAFLSFSAAFLFWSVNAYTDIPGLFLSMLAFLTYIKGGKFNGSKEHKSKNGIKRYSWYFISGLLAALAFLTKYTSAYIIFSLFLYEIFIRKKTDIKGDIKGYIRSCMKSYFIFLLVAAFAVSPWFYYNWQSYQHPFYPLIENFRLAKQPNKFKEDLNILISLNPILIISSVIYLLRRKITKSDKTLIILFAPILLFFVFFAHREVRFFLLPYPLITAFAAVFLVKNFKRVVFYFLVISSILMIYHTVTVIGITNRYNNLIKEFSLSTENFDGTFYSNFWPQVAYYAEKDVSTFPWPPQILIESVENGKVQYFAIYYPFLEPCYLEESTLDKLPFLNKVVEKEKFNQRLIIYEVDPSKFSQQDGKNYLSILRC